MATTVKPDPAVDEPEPTPADTDAATLDLLEPRYDAREWTLGIGETSETFTQRPLGFFGKMEWYALVSAAVDEVLQSEGGDEVGVLIAQIFGPGIDVALNDPQGMTGLISGFSKLTMAVPDFLADSFCIWLGIPREKRTWAKWAMEQPPDEGGLSDEMGEEIIETFIDQNAEAMRAFFAKGGPKVLKRLQSRLGFDPKPSSKPSRSSRRNTGGKRSTES
jgi:hypothetical protein